MKDQKNLWVWVGVVVVVIVAVAVGVTWFFGRSPSAPTGPVPVHAPMGQVIEGFPQDLILGTATSSGAGTNFFAGITNSYSINYSSSINQYTAEWVSSSTPAALYAQYQDYITNNGWTVTNNADTTELYAIYATNASSSVINIVIIPQSQAAQGASDKGSKVTVSYVGQ